MKTRTDRLSGVTAISKALRVLEYVGLRNETELGEIAQDMGLPKSTLHRILSTLVREEYLTRTRHGAYQGSLKLWRLGANVTDYESVRERVLPVLRQLVDDTSETAHYAVYEGGYSVYIAKVDAIHPIRAGSSVGGRAAAHASATGKAVLAWRSDEEIARVAEQAKPFTPATITHRAALLHATAEIRRAGVAYSRGELFASLWAVAAPIVQPTGEVHSAVGVAGPAARVEAHLDSYARAVARAAASLSAPGVTARRIG